MSKKILSALLAAVLLASATIGLASCGKTGNSSETTGTNLGTQAPGSSGTVTPQPDDKYAGIAIPDDADYEEKSEIIYEAVLGEFYDLYQNAKKETNVSKKWALMAIAEAKLMGSAVMLPLSTNGGNYAISRVAPNTVDYTLWGNDNYRYHQALVATDFIKSEDRVEMKAKWGELKGTGTYMDWAKQFLADKGYTLQDTYALSYSSDPQTWDVLATSRAADSEALVNTYDGLYEYDVEGEIKPALAESYTLSEDGLKYTFKIREGFYWVDSQGRQLGEITADDFVAGMQHMLDAAGGLEYLVQGIIVNASEYIDEEITDFAEVGVKATDKYTLEYTLEAPCSYFMTMLGYGVFAPMNRAFYESQGGQFGEEFDDAAEGYTYGQTPDNIAYCGPYRVTNLTAENTIIFSQNENYWNKDNINIKTIKWLFNDGKETTKAYEDAKAGTIAGAGLNPSTLVLAKNEGLFEKYGYVSATDATSFCAFVNVNRAQFVNINDNASVASPNKDNQAELDRTNAAMQNVHFRRAVAFSLNRATYNAQTVGEDLKLFSLRNTYTPGTFVKLEEDVTVSINGTDKTYPAGTNYGVIMQDQLDADGVKIKVWDPAADDGLGSSDGFDGWYNVDNAAAELAIAIEELKEIGIEISAENPIQIDYPCYVGSESYANRGQAYKKSLESALNNMVKVNVINCETAAEWYYAGYYTESGEQANYDIYDVSGWGPDYGDPSTYLDTFLPDYAGYMVKCLGIF